MGIRSSARTALVAVIATLVVAVPSQIAVAAPTLFDVPPVPAGTPSILDGDPVTTERLLSGEPIAAAVAASKVRFPDPGAGRTATHAVLARADDVADALAGSALLGDGPLLLTGTRALDRRARAELGRVLRDGSSVYLLGGERALGSRVADDVRALGLRPVRLAGATRVETAVRVAREVQARTGSRDLVLARAHGTREDPTAGWADAVSVGGLAAALGVPVALTPRESLHPAVADLIRASGVRRTILLGGTAALSSAVAAAVPAPVRLSGADRTATAVDIARRGWGATSGRGAFLAVNGEQRDGGAFGLVAAGLSADARAPVLLVSDTVSDPVRSLVSRCGEPAVDLAVVGDGTRVSASVRERLDRLDGDACGRDGAIVTSRRLSSLDTCTDVLDYYRELALERVGPWGLDGGFHVEPIAVEAPAEDSASGGGQARDVSDTNVQEAGVDEPDLVETDGDRAFAVARGGVQVLDLTGSAPRVAGQLELPDGSHELLLRDDRLLVLSRIWGTWSPEPRFEDDRAASSSMPAASRRTVLTLFDVADVDRPQRLGSAELDGELRSARMVDGVARVVLQTWPEGMAFTSPEEDSAAAREAAAEHNRQVVREATLEAWTGTYTTRDAAGTVTGEAPLVPCGAIAAPPRPGDLGTVSVVTFDVTGDGLEPTSSAAVAASSDTVYASKARLVVATTRWAGWTPDAGDAGRTELHAFDISDPAATRYVASGAVAGFLLNSFSLSEHDGFLRVAATEGAPWGTEPSSSSTLSVLEEQGSELVRVGRVGGLGQGERIFAVRFLGDLAAVVTFRQVDPLYLLDLSDPRAPAVTGELKIPGFSSYLHRVGEDILLGVGQDADAEGRIRGTQVATYDMSDRTAPRQVDKVVFPGAHSEVEHDHHAFLHWAPSRLAVVPIDQWREDGSGFHGAVGLTVGATGSLTEHGRVSHPSQEAWPSTVRRSFVVDDRLYTVSEAGIAVDRLSDLVRVAWTPFG